eukprot:3444144-Prymnesium_polylepis.1
MPSGTRNPRRLAPAAHAVWHPGGQPRRLPPPAEPTPFSTEGRIDAFEHPSRDSSWVQHSHQGCTQGGSEPTPSSTRAVQHPSTRRCVPARLGIALRPRPPGYRTRCCVPARRAVCIAPPLGRYHTSHIDVLMLRQPDAARALLEEVWAALPSLPSLPSVTFGMGALSEALDHMARGAHVGK